MPPSDYPLTTLRAALQGLVHELYFKSPHFPGLRRHSPKAVHDQDNLRYDALTETVLLGTDDPFTALLSARLDLLQQHSADLDHRATLDNWQRAESTLNARMSAIFGFLGPRLPNPVITMLCGAAVTLPEMRVTAGRNPIGGKRADGSFGQPDIVLLGGNDSISIEMKVRGGTARATYGANQHFKYLRLAEELEKQRGVTRSYHVLLAPFGRYRVIKKSRSWLDNPEGHSVPIVTDSTRLFAALGERARGRVLGGGGMTWLDALLNRLPSRCVDLGALLDVIEASAPLTTALEVPLEHEISMMRTYAFPPSRSAKG